MPKKAYKKRADGRYAVYRDRKPFYGATIAEAEAARRLYDLEKAQGLVQEKKGMRVSQYADEWLPVHRKRSGEASFALYKKILDSFVLFTRDARLKDVKKTDVIAFYNTLDGYSQSYIDKYKATIHGMFSSAKEDGIISRDPSLDASAPDGSIGTLEHRALEDWERDLVHRMVDYEYKANGETRHGHPFAVAAMVMLYQGLRREEVLALDVDRDVDFEKNILHVRTAWSFTNNHRGALKKTKTAAGERNLPLFAPTRNLLYGRHGSIVTAIKAEQMTESAFSRMWESYKYQMSVLHNNGLRPRWDKEGKFKPVTIRTHDFRHSFCTMICEAGVGIKTAMKWMGHTDEKMIRQVYEHVTQKRLEKEEQNTAKMIEKIMSNSQNDSQTQCFDHQPQ